MIELGIKVLRLIFKEPQMFAPNVTVIHPVAAKINTIKSWNVNMWGDKVIFNLTSRDLEKHNSDSGLWTIFILDSFTCYYFSTN